MNLRKNFLAHAVACAAASIAVPAHSQQATKSLAPVIVTADPFGASENAMILAPAKVLAGDELRNKLGSSLGDTLGSELGVSASGFSTGASRPIIRGLEGPRVKILQNGMLSGDLSAISNDHAVGSGMMSATQIEILRGPAALLYGSGAIGGVVNIVNGRIPTALAPRATGEAELRYGTVDQGTGLSFSADRSAGNIGLHVDGNVMNAGDYRIPGNSWNGLGDDAGNNSTGKLVSSRNRENNIAVGGSLIQDWGFIGASLSQLNKVYDIHGRDELARIDLAQTRFDVDSYIKSPFAGFEGLRVKLGQTDYRHTELEDRTDPHVRFSNKAFESRWELTHLPIAGWRGKFGLQTEQSTVQALNLEGENPTVPRTRSQSTAGFIVEERDFGDLRVNVGGRFESVSRRPVEGASRSFNLGSVSAGALWSFIPGYGVGSTLSLAQRAPTAEELYSDGVHHPTETYDIGNATLKKETSNNIDLSLQKTTEALRWKANVFQNKVKNFVYGAISENPDYDPITNPEAMELNRTFSQADATLRGAEAELSYNYYDPGWFGRVFADTSRGTLDNLGNLPLQPTTRKGLSFGYQDAQWRSSLSVLHADRHTRIASDSISRETPTSAYTRVDASINYIQRFGTTDITWFLLARNLLNEEIRLSTSLLKDYVPQPGRNFIIGLRTRF